MFHVKHSLAEAKPPEQRVEHIFHPGPAGQSVESRAGSAQVLCDQNRVVGPCGRTRSSQASLREMRRLAPIERNRILRRQHGARAARPPARASRFQALTRHRRHGERPPAEASLGQADRTRMHPNQPRMSAALRPARRATAACRRPRPEIAARSTPMRSTTSSVSRKPAVSVSRIGTPPSASGTSIWSRVVPGMSVTIARSCPLSH